MSTSIEADSQYLGNSQESNNSWAYEITVIVVTYKPIWEKLKLTLDSIITQTGISLQIIVADDGSENNLFDKISDYFNSNGFSDYKLVSSNVNHGTVINLLNACLKADGKYIKSISPGDCIYKSDTLSKWVMTLKISGKKWSFCDVIYYRIIDNVPNTVISTPHPQYVRPYKKSNDNECRWSYVVYEDIVLGASVLSEKNILIHYLNRIANKVIYAEDMVFKLMMFDGEIGFYFNAEAILYEYGTGISTCGDKIWLKRIEKDIDTADAEILCSNAQDKFRKNLSKALLYKKTHHSKISYVFMKGKLKMSIYIRLFKRTTSNIDVSNLPYFKNISKDGKNAGN